MIFPTQKRDGTVKSRACVNGSKQHEKINKEAAASPTVMNDSVMITSAIEAHEGRNVVTLDLPGAFLHTDLDEDIVMLLTHNSANFGSYIKNKSVLETLKSAESIGTTSSAVGKRSSLRGRQS